MSLENKKLVQDHKLDKMRKSMFLLSALQTQKQKNGKLKSQDTLTKEHYDKLM